MKAYLEIEMPKNGCTHCPLARRGSIFSRICVITEEYVDGNYERGGFPTECPLQKLPPHGRLIDADALIDDLKRQCKEVFRIDAVSPEDFWINRNEAYRQRLYESWCEGFYEYVGSRSTIIPAEPPKEET